MVLVKRESADLEWTYGAIPFARNETHAKVVETMEREPGGKVLDVPAGAGILAGRLTLSSSCEKRRLRCWVADKLRFEVSGDR
jgi:hypothetical protein